MCFSHSRVIFNDILFFNDILMIHILFASVNAWLCEECAYGCTIYESDEGNVTKCTRYITECQDMGERSRIVCVWQGKVYGGKLRKNNIKSNKFYYHSYQTLE